MGLPHPHVSTKDKDHAGDEEFCGRRSSHLEQFTLPAALCTATLSGLTFARHMKAHLFGWSTAHLRNIYDILQILSLWYWSWWSWSWWSWSLLLLLQNLYSVQIPACSSQRRCGYGRGQGHCGRGQGRCGHGHGRGGGRDGRGRHGRRGHHHLFRREPLGISGTLLRADCPSCYPNISVKTLNRTQNINPLTSDLASSFLHSQALQQPGVDLPWRHWSLKPLLEATVHPAE